MKYINKLKLWVIVVFLMSTSISTLASFSQIHERNDELPQFCAEFGEKYTNLMEVKIKSLRDQVGGFRQKLYEISYVDVNGNYLNEEYRGGKSLEKNEWLTVFIQTDVTDVLIRTNSDQQVLTNDGLSCDIEYENQFPFWTAVIIIMIIFCAIILIGTFSEWVAW